MDQIKPIIPEIVRYHQDLKQLRANQRKLFKTQTIQDLKDQQFTLPALPQNKFRDSNLVDESDHTRNIMSPREATEKLATGRDNYNIKSQTVRHRPKAEIIKVNTFY